MSWPSDSIGIECLEIGSQTTSLHSVRVYEITIRGTMNSTVIGHARVLWEYFASIRKETYCSAVVVCCSYDLRVMDYAVELLERDMTDTIVISGDRGHWTGKFWDEPESTIFHEYARDRLNGYKVLMERSATNFSENIRYSLDLIRPMGEVLFVTKPNSLYRVHLTVPMVDSEIRYSVSCPEIEFPDGVSKVVGLIGIINEMVGDVDRILTYPELGYQVPHTLPDEVVRSWKYLVDRGFVDHMLN